jgi:N-acetyl-anhydromuramyl-L-alanine amidase AmpD
LKTEIIGIHSRPSHNGQASKDRAKNDHATAKKKSADPAQLYSKIVERYAMFFDRPEARLRFLNNTLTKQAERQAQLRQSLRRVRFLENTRFYEWLLEARVYSAILEEMRAMSAALPSDKRELAQQIQAPFSARALFLIHQSRHAFYAGAVIFAGLLLLGLYSLATWTARGVNSYLAQRYNSKRQPIVVIKDGPTPKDAFTAASAYLPNYKPEKVWLVERNDEHEKYSNGCRILTKYETDNHLRGYYSIPRGADTDGEEPRNKIVGIVYHTPESDIVSFTPDNNEEIQKRSRGLLEYVRDHKSYNYMIDRYGEIYRIVRDEHAANHAGNSIWADAKNTYVLLNESFLGVCFESKFGEGGALDEILTEAQIISGRALTNVLRSKYNIDDANCTTHGLVSINPDKTLIAWHHDWVRNFPFEAMGLSDKYRVQPPNMSDYGFTYDEETLAKLGNKLWEGAIAAEAEFKNRAEKARVNPDILRRKLRDRYIAQREKTHKLRVGPGEAEAPQLAEKGAGAGESTESGNH